MARQRMSFSPVLAYGDHLPHVFKVPRGIDLLRIKYALDDPDPVAMLQGPQLFQGLGSLQIPPLHLRKSVQKSHPIGARTDMFIMARGRGGWYDIGHGGTGKIKGKSLPIYDHLYYARVGYLFQIRNRVH